ncbi:MAG: DUF4178 domain-containing protein [Nanoarchaeota archaeon]|nr:DUF4178 domain-containing protein [Nanoarchaeota archaeon]
MSELNPAFSMSLARQFNAIRQLSPENLILKKDRWNHTIKDVKKSGFICYDGRTYLVKEVGSYQEFDEKFVNSSSLPWFELKLFCIDTGEIVNLEWEEDDDIEVSMTLKELKFSDLRDDEREAVDEDDLDQIAEEEEGIFFGGKKFDYDDDYPAKYYRNSIIEGGDKVYMYEFEAQDGTCLTIEEWQQSGGKEEYKIYLSSQIDVNNIEIISLGG